VTDAGCNVHLLPLFNTLGCLTGFAVDGSRIRAALRQIQPDIVHVHGTLAYSHAALERGWPSILTMHGIYYREVASKRGKDWLQTRLACAYEVNAVRRARHISALNRYSTNAYKEHIRTGDVRYIDNPINDIYFSVPDRAEPGRILFGGFIYDLKNLLYLLQALVPLVGRHPDLRLRVAGGVREQQYYERCTALIAEHGIERNVEFLGPLSTEQMIDEHSKASMLILCSKQENAPMIISEAMAAGRPVIGTPVGGVPEMVEHGKTGFIVPLDNPEELAGRIECLLADPGLARRMGEAGKATAEQRFKRSVVVEKTMSFYKDVIESERRQR
jgi:glycosyltransferase involved in cell wall biosynthesis